MLLRLGLAAAFVALIAVGLVFLRSPASGDVWPFARLVDPPGSTGPLTHDHHVASLQDETRYVLTAPRRQLLFLKEIVAPPDAHFRKEVVLPIEFLIAERVALIPRFRRGTIRTDLPISVVDVQTNGNVRSVAVDLALPADSAGETLGINIEGFALEPNRDLTHRTAPILIPDGAYLGFAIGVSQPAPSAEPIEFVARACAGVDCTTLFTEVVDAGTEGGHWQDRRVSLASLGGETRTLVFEAHRAAEGQGLSFPLWANPTVYAPASGAPPGANVILLSIDTLAARHLPSYGYGFDTAPFIQRHFADKGTIFDRCLAAATTTPQSHMTMFMGVQPCVHGVLTGNEEASRSIPTLAELLRAHGYETGAVTDDGWLGYGHGFGRGFNVYAENKSADIMAPEGQIDVTFDRARHWLEQNRDKPFFLFLHTFQVHDPYSPPAALQKLFTQRDGAEVTADSPRPLREVVAYDQEIRYTDDELAKFVGYLEESGLAANTVLVLTSDHGEEFFEHGLWGHGATFFEEITHVPLMLWGGDVPAGKRIDTLVGHVDLAPTILELTGAATPAYAMGQSLMSLARGEAADSGRRVRYGEARVDFALGANYDLIPVTPPGFLVQRGTHKLARYLRNGRHEYEYFDLASDPGEKYNLFSQNPPGVAELRPLVDGYENLCLSVALSAGETAPGQQRQVPLDPAAEEKLRALGYLK